MALFACVACLSIGTRGGAAPAGQVREMAAAVIQTCTSQNIAGYPYSGTVCGGWTQDSCTPGLLYNCTGGPRGTQNNCTLTSTCNPGCLSGAQSSPVTLNTQTPTANDACFSGAAPMTLSAGSITGGSDNITMTATLQAAHSPYAIVNLNALGASIAQPCGVPIQLPPASSSLAVTLPTAVVTSQAQAAPWVLTNYNDSNGHNRNLVGLPQPLTINSGGRITIPPLASFSVVDFNGNVINTLAGGASANTQGSLTSLAPFGGVSVSVTGSPAGQITGGNFTIDAGCTSLPGPASTFGDLLVATASDTSNKTVTVTADSGGGAPLSQNITITPPPLAIGNVLLNPTSVSGGSAFTATVTTNRVVTASDPSSLVSVRVSEGLPSGVQVATFTGCSGSPACTGPLTIPVGASSASVAITTSPVTSQQSVTVAADATWSQVSASANVTINTGSCTPKTCASLGFNCGSAPDGCGGTLNCGGTCTAPAVCNSNVCCTPATSCPAGENCGSVSDGCGGTLNCGACGVGQSCIGNVCSTCSPNTCSGLGFNCGSTADGCGGSLNCGTCAGGQTCTSNVCVAATALSSLTLNPTSVSGRNSSTGTVTLSGPAPAGGAVVSLSSSNTSVASVPSKVTVAAGATKATFTVATQRVNSTTTVTISGSYNGTTKSSSLTVTSRH